MKAYIFPGQGSQFTGMGQDLYNSSENAKHLFNIANELLGFEISKLMFEGTKEELMQTNVTQPAIFIHSCILAACTPNFQPNMVAGHSLGEFSALVAAKTISFEDGLLLVSKRAEAMHKACQNKDSTMAAVIGLQADIIEETCLSEPGIVTAANYNTPEQIVISGETKSIDKVCIKLSEIGAKKTVKLSVNGAFHSPIMSSAKNKLEKAINSIQFKAPLCPIYQNVSAQPNTNPIKIKENLILQLTSPVKWYQTIQQMIIDGASAFFEIGPGNVLSGLNRRIDRNVPISKGTF